MDSDDYYAKINLMAKRKDKVLKPHHEAVGRVVLAWNEMHERLGELFSVLLMNTESRAAYAVWHSTPSDLSQRKMLDAAYKARFQAADKEYQAIEWLLTKVDNLSSKRNDAIHAPLYPVFDLAMKVTVRPTTFTGSPRAKSLRGKSLLAEFDWYAKTASELGYYALKLKYGIMAHDAPWPDKPQLPTLQLPGPRPARKSSRPRPQSSGPRRSTGSSPA